MRYLFALFTAAHASSFAASPTPETAAEAFYQWVIASMARGAPLPNNGSN
jgi:hypothetical protein